MGREIVTFSKQQIEYIKRVYSTTINTNITPNTTINTIMYNSGILAVIKTIEDNSIDTVPNTPARR